MKSVRQLGEHLASIAGSNPDLRVAGEWELLADQVDPVALQLDHLLPGTGTRRGDVAGKGQRSRSQMNRGDRLARNRDQVDHVAHALDVLEEELARIIEVDMRLRCS